MAGSGGRRRISDYDVVRGTETIYDIIYIYTYS